MARKRTGRFTPATRQSGHDPETNDPDNNQFINNGSEFITLTDIDYTTPHATITPDVVVLANLWDELGDEQPPLIPLWLLLLSDATPAEIASRLRLNFALRCLVDALAESEVASW